MSLPLIEVPAGPGVRAVFTTREGGVSGAPFAGLNLGADTGDDRAAVRENRRMLCAALGIDRERVTMGRQVHGAGVRRITAPTRPGRFTGALEGWPEGDGLVTSRPGLALVVRGADCLPLLLWRRDGSAVAACHAGWRGLVAGVVEAAVEALGDPARAAAAIGPGAGPCCYRVDGALRERFRARFGDGVVCGEAVDLAGAARRALVGAGVGEDAVMTHGGCTVCDASRFFSYRRDGAATGRHAGVVWIAERPARMADCPA